MTLSSELDFDIFCEKRYKDYLNSTRFPISFYEYKHTNLLGLRMEHGEMISNLAFSKLPNPNLEETGPYYKVPIYYDGENRIFTYRKVFEETVMWKLDRLE